MAGLDAGRFAIGVAGGTGGERGQVKLPRRDGPTAELVARVIPSHNRDGGWLDHALESSATRSGKVPDRAALSPIARCVWCQWWCQPFSRPSSQAAGFVT